MSHLNKQTNKTLVPSSLGCIREAHKKAQIKQVYEKCIYYFLYSYRSKQSDLIRHSNPITSVAYVRLPQTRLSKHFLKQKISSISVIMKDLGGVVEICQEKLKQNSSVKIFASLICLFGNGKSTFSKGKNVWLCVRKITML